MTYPLEPLADGGLPLHLGLNHLLLLAAQLHLLLQALLLPYLLQRTRGTTPVNRVLPDDLCLNSDQTSVGRRGTYLLELQLKDLLLVGVGLVLSLDAALLGAFLLGAARPMEREE